MLAFMTRLRALLAKLPIVAYFSVAAGTLDASVIAAMSHLSDLVLVLDCFAGVCMHACTCSKHSRAAAAHGSLWLLQIPTRLTVTHLAATLAL